MRDPRIALYVRRRTFLPPSRESRFEVAIPSSEGRITKNCLHQHARLNSVVGCSDGPSVGDLR
jgi:hypothetical protein